MVTATHGLHDGGASQFRSAVTRQTAIGTEERCARIARARAPLVAIGVADDADSVVLRKRVVQEPFEGPP